MEREINETITINDSGNQPESSILTFPDGAVFYPRVTEGLMEGKYEVMSKEGILIAELNYENNKVNGLCKFYEGGLLKKKVSFVKGKMEGWSEEDGKEYMYRNNCKEFVLVKSERLEGYFDEKSIETGKLNRCFKMDKNHRPIGVGTVYKDGEISSVMNFKGECEAIVIKEFKDGRMIERDESGNVIYEGEFMKDDFSWFPRHGYGKESKGNEIYFGEWVSNHKEGQGKLLVNGRIRYDGIWKNDIANGEGILYDSDYQICKGEWKDGVCKKDGKEYHFCHAKKEVELKRNNSLWGSIKKSKKNEKDVDELKEWLNLLIAANEKKGRELEEREEKTRQEEEKLNREKEALLKKEEEMKEGKRMVEEKEKEINQKEEEMGERERRMNAKDQELKEREERVRIDEQRNREDGECIKRKKGELESRDHLVKQGEERVKQEEERLSIKEEELNREGWIERKREEERRLYEGKERIRVKEEEINRMIVDLERQMKEVEDLKKRSNWIVRNSSDLEKLMKNSKKDEVNGIIVGSGSCYNWEKDVEIKGFNNLLIMYIKKDSLKKTKSLMICNNENLKMIDIENGELWNDNGRWYSNGSFHYAQSLVFKGRIEYG